MILTPHAILGATLANIFPNEPALGFSLAFVSHYVLDVIPHADYDITGFLDKDTKTVKSIVNNIKGTLHFLCIIFDFSVAVLLCILFFVRDGKSLIITFIGILGGVLPDFFQFLYYKYKKQPWIFFQMVHKKVHNLDKMEDRRLCGFLIQFFVIIFILSLYFYFK